VQVLTGLLDKMGLPLTAIEEVILGHCYPTMDAPAIGRVVALDAGLPVTTTGLQIDRRCGSGLQAVIDAVARVETMACDIVVAGGVESMSRAPYYSVDSRWGLDADGITFHDSLARGRVTAGGSRFPEPGGMVATAERLREQYGISRHEQDALAVMSHRRAVTAQGAGLFDEEIIPITVRARTGASIVSTDEHPRPNVSMEALGALKPLRAGVDPASTVTAGNASGQNDGAALCIVTTAPLAASLGLRPFARLVGWAVAGVAPQTMGIGPVPAVSKVLQRTGVAFDDIDLIEVNEAFAVQVLAIAREWEYGELGSPRWQRTNVNGSGVSLGHPVGATGARIVATMLRELDRRSGRYALETMCIGGGQGLAALFENVQVI
jgi:acetyl-CoA C-acetyltransferase